MLLSREEIKRLPSEAKVEYYRSLGFHVGWPVSIGDGTVFSVDYLDIGDDVTIGRFNDIRGGTVKLGNDIAIGDGNHVLCPGGFRLGSCTNFGNDNEVVCYNFEAGDYLQAYDDIEVGLGGNMSGVNCLVSMGEGCFIGSRCILNTSDAIIIGDDVGIGAEAMIWTHGGYLDATMGFPTKFAPVRIGDHVWLPSRSICLPGVTIGDNVVIGINSLVNKDVPSGCLAAGMPIRVLRENVYPCPLTNRALQTLAEGIVERYLPFAKWKGLRVDHLRYDSERECIVLRNSSTSTYFFLREKRIEGPTDIVIEDFRDFLRRNGIKIFTGKRFRSITPPAYERWVKEKGND